VGEPGEKGSGRKRKATLIWSSVAKETGARETKGKKAVERGWSGKRHTNAKIAKSKKRLI